MSPGQLKGNVMTKSSKASWLIIAVLWLAMGRGMGVETSQTVKLNELPAAAQATIQAEKNKAHGKIGEIEKVTEDQDSRYEIELIQGKNERSFSVSPEGKLLSRQVFMREIPEPARKAIQEQARSVKGKIGDIDRVFDEENITYDVEILKGGQTNSFCFSAEGKLLSLEMALAETTPEVRKAILAQTGKGTVEKIEKDFDEDENGAISYEVTVETAGKKVVFTLDAKGGLIDSD